MPEPATSIPLILATLATALAFVIAVRRVRIAEAERPHHWPMHLLLGGVTLLCAAVFLYRLFVVHQAWQPLQAHVDGLLLIATLLAPSILYIQTRPRLFGLSLFAMPLLALILLWGVCASLWTFRPFNLPEQEGFIPVWRVFHTAATYLGLLGCGLGAAAGAMYLFVQRRLKAKAGLGQVNPMASLETLETLILRAATLGFVLLTLSLVSGFILIETGGPSFMAQAWWASPKVWLAAAAWAVYALLINIRSFSSFRGNRAAWLAIAGLVLVLATYASVEALNKAAPAPEAPEPSAEEEAR